MSAAAGSFASRWGGLAVWEDEGFEPGVSPYFQPQGLWDVGLPLYLALFAVAAAIQVLERRLFGRFDAERRGEKGEWRQQITAVFMTGTLSRAMLLLLLWAPPTFLRQRWDWVCTAPVAFETIAFFWYWRILPRNFKQVVVGHHVFVLLVVWPLARLIESTPYPISILTMPVFYEVGSLWSYFSFVVKNRVPDMLRLLGLEAMEGQAISSLICLCFAGQRLLRAAALWEGIPFLASHPEYDSVGARCLQVVMIGLEARGAISGYRFLPRADEWKSSSGAAGKRKKAVKSPPGRRGPMAAGH